MPRNDDPVLRNARREAWVLIGAWALATIYCCVASYLTGYDRPGHRLGVDDLRPIFGIPGWFFWSVLVPWAICGVFTLVYVGFFMKDDDLGADRAVVVTNADGPADPRNDHE